MPEWIHPGLLLIGGALLVPAFRGTARRAWLVALTAGALAAALFGGEGTRGAVAFLDLPLVFGRVDRLANAFGIVFTLMALLGIIYSLHEEDAAGHQAALVYAGSALGAVYAGDLVTLFLFWELMAVSSVVLIWGKREPASLAAGYRYLLLHVAGGASLLAGIAVHYKATGSLAFERLAGSPGDGLILAGFLLNAAVPPLSAWLTDAYPEATVTGAVFLSAFTTKTAVYALVRGFPGNRIAGLDGRRHGPLRRGLRDAAERRPPPAGLPHRQPGGLHGLRRRARDGTGAERLGRPRLRPHPLQGAPLHGRRGGPARHRQASPVGHGRPAPDHAPDLRPLHGRGAVDLGLAADLRLHQQVDHHRRRRAPSTGRSSS